MSSEGYWEGKNSSLAAKCKNTDQTDLIRGGLNKIRFGKVLGESPQTQVFSESDQAPSNPSGVQSTAHYHNHSNAPKHCIFGLRTAVCLFLNFSFFFNSLLADITGISISWQKI